jgi:hypothetical protein
MKITPTYNRRLRDTIRLAIAQETNANNAMQAFRKQLEVKYGMPISFESIRTGSAAGGTVRPYWDQHTDVRHHSICLAPCEPWARPHKAAHELMHIALECEANAAGKRMACSMSPDTFGKLLSRCEPPHPNDTQLLNKVSSLAKNFSVDMVVEARLQRELTAVAAAQFANLHLYQSATRGDLQSWNGSPNLLLALGALVAMRSLFVETYFPDPSQSHFAQFRGTPAGDLAEKLLAEFKTRFDRGLQPGEHYELMNRHAEIIGLPDLHSWSAKTKFEIKAEYDLALSEKAARTPSPLDLSVELM